MWRRARELARGGGARARSSNMGSYVYKFVCVSRVTFETQLGGGPTKPSLPPLPSFVV